MYDINISSKKSFGTFMKLLHINDFPMYFRHSQSEIKILLIIPVIGQQASSFKIFFVSLACRTTKLFFFKIK